MAGLPGLLLVLLAPRLGLAQLPGAGEPLRLGPGDGIRLVVENEPELAGEYVVGTDGVLILPLAGSVEAAGRAFVEVEADIRDRLARELASGMAVQIVPVFRVAVLGEVRTPGLHPVDPTLTLADVLALAGGFTPLADRGRIRLLRGGRTVVEGDEDLVFGQAPPLRPGDRVVVARKGWFRENLGVVIGAVGSLTVAIVTGLIVR